MKRYGLLTLLLAAAVAVGWTSAGDVKITGTLKSKIQEFYGATGTNFVRIPDNAASALIVEDTTNGSDLLSFVTTNGSELISFNVPVNMTSGNQTFGNVGISGTLGVTGAATFRSTMSVAGLLTAPSGLSGPLTGNVTGNVTGNLTGNVTGDLAGSVTATTAATVTAFAGGGQASATQLSADINMVTTVATAGDSVKLHATPTGKLVTVTNNGNENLAVFPASGDQFLGMGVNESILLPTEHMIILRGLSATMWSAQATMSPKAIYFPVANDSSILFPDNASQGLVLATQDDTPHLVLVSTTGAERVEFGVPIVRKNNDAVTAAGSDKTDCTQLTADFNVVAGTWPAGVCMPTATAGRHVTIVGDSSEPVMVYPLDANNAQFTMPGLGGNFGADTGFAIAFNGRLECDGAYGDGWLCDYRLGGEIDSGVAAAGTNQATATALASARIGTFVRMTGANGSNGVTLPDDDVATCVGVRNIHASSDGRIYGHANDDDTIDGGAADAAIVLRASVSVVLCTTDGTAWYSTGSN